MGSMTENIADKAINDTRIVKQFTNPVKEPIDSDINLFDLLDNRAKRDPEGAMIEYKGDDGTWQPYSAQVFRDMVIDLAKGLIGLGVNKGDSVAIVSRTRWEWTALDMAIMSIGALTVPVYETNSASQVSWIFNDSKVTLAIAEDDGQRDKIESVRDEVPTLRNVFVIEDGELVVKGPLVCKGYHNNPGVTTQQITDGWLHTGDLGDISEDGFISITGRKKDLIITAGGKNVSPGLLEASVMTSPVVNQCLVIGDKKPFVAALVTLDLADANKWLESQGAKPEPDLASLAKNAIVHAEVERAVNAANEGVSRAESIRKFEILPDEFTEANGMLTPSLKTRRAQIVEHYRELIDDVIYVPLKK